MSCGIEKRRISQGDVCINRGKEHKAFIPRHTLHRERCDEQKI